MRCWLALAVVCLGSPSLSRGDVAVPMPPANRAALVDAIIVGRVVAHEDKDIDLGAGGKHRVAVVNVTDQVLGARDLKTIRVAYLPARAAEPMIRPRPAFGAPQLELGVDGLFYLTRQAKGDLFLAPAYFDLVLRTSPTFEKELAETKEAARLLADPLASLKAADAQARFKTAALLVTHYRTPRPGGGKAEAIPADESKLILRAILDARWDAPQVFGQPHPWSTFLQLGLNAKHGWTLPAGGGKGLAEFHAAARAWLERNWEKHTIERLTPAAR